MKRLFVLLMLVCSVSFAADTLSYLKVDAERGKIVVAPSTKEEVKTLNELDVQIALIDAKIKDANDIRDAQVAYLEGQKAILEKTRKEFVKLGIKVPVAEKLVSK